MRDKLIMLIIDGFSKCTKPHECYAQLDLEALADYLIAHGVTVQADVPDIVVRNKSAIWVLNKRYGDYECSECEQGNVTALHFRTLKMTYCPNCGAKMDLEDGG